MMRLKDAFVKVIGIGNKLKDDEISKYILAWINSQYRKYGDFRRLDINSETRAITAEVLPAGEVHPINISCRYETARIDGRPFLRVHQIVVSREWINLLVQDYLKGEKMFELPESLWRTISVAM